MPKIAIRCLACEKGARHPHRSRDSAPGLVSVTSSGDTPTPRPTTVLVRAVWIFLELAREVSISPPPVLRGDRPRCSPSRWRLAPSSSGW